MRKFVSSAVIIAFALSVGSLALAQEKSEGSWTGWVTETHCGAKGAKAEHADCAVKCVKEKGAKWALYNTDTKNMFVLSGDQEGLEKMAGKKVMVKGKMDKDKKEIAVSSVEMAP
jgi:hypothetical protein